MPLGRRVNKEVMEMYEADQRLADTYKDRLAEAAEAEKALRAAETEGRDAELHELAIAFDKALTEVLLAAEAAERVAAGTKTYVPESADAKTRRAAEIARRKAKARPAVTPLTGEVDRLRTAREQHRMAFRVRPATIV
ncbi:plectin [Actinomadura rudentiformis]|uniref:Plectin n=1 Tax=Actinomadura rudentiformis TaxID=359158 RepID=A0A6H9Y8H5_9ACTN|nr:plectin [Actinomadura rudentiformis]KAB2339478.1 plectin [Actinomadura rudentiformis]